MRLQQVLFTEIKLWEQHNLIEGLNTTQYNRIRDLKSEGSLRQVNWMRNCKDVAPLDNVIRINLGQQAHMHKCTYAPSHVFTHALRRVLTHSLEISLSLSPRTASHYQLETDVESMTRTLSHTHPRKVDMRFTMKGCETVSSTCRSVLVCSTSQRV